jgi:redox-sensitive bicupin YhaK (pirin superfamily)
MKTKPVIRLLTARPTLEGAGVRLKRVFGNNEVPLFDPFLLFDDFRGYRTEDYIAGFPWHPHRGIETVTYLLSGEVEHGDSLGNAGVIGPGDVQWMTAGSGIIHQEMPRGDADGKMEGFQLWVNLPASHKMMKPRYRDMKGIDFPVAQLPGGGTARIISGSFQGIAGPSEDLVAAPRYLDIRLPAGSRADIPVPEGDTAFAYVFGGGGAFGPNGETPAANLTCLLFGPGDTVTVTAGGEGLSFLLCSGTPLGEPVAWGGPIVMNTKEELETAFEEYHAGTFIK